LIAAGGALRERELALLVGAGDRDHALARRPRELNGGRSHAAGGGLHQHRLVLKSVGGAVEQVIRDLIIGQRSGGVEVDSRG
jgi:hypothetical protein